MAKGQRKIKKYITKNNSEYNARLSYNQESPSLVEKTGFSSHELAMQWLDDEIDKIIPNYRKMSFFQLAMVIKKDRNNIKALNELKYKVQNLKEEMLFTFIAKEEMPEKKALALVNNMCGAKWEDSFEKAINNTLDALISLEQEKTQQRLQNMLQQFQASQWKGSEEALNLLNIIRTIPGSKKITCVGNLNEVAVFDIKEDGYVGYDSGHKNLLLKEFDEALDTEGSFIVRQFIPDSEELTTVANGKKIKIPWKAIYSFILYKGSLIPIPADEVDYSCNHDIHGNPIERETMVIYKNFSDFLDGNSVFRKD